jgi:hypothetical protein
MKKWRLIGGAVLLVLAAAAWWVFTSLDWLVKSAIESRGPLLTGTPVTVASVRISASDGRGTLSGLDIGNPPGFSTPYALRANTISVAIDPASLTAAVPVIREIVIDAPDITYENTGTRGNLELIQRNIESAVRGESAQAKGQGGAHKPARRFVIDRVLIRQARVSIHSPLLKGGMANFVLPDVELRGLGAGGQGVTGAEAARQVVAAMSTKIAVNAALSGDVLKKGLDSLLQRIK